MFRNRLFISYVLTAALYVLVLGVFVYLQQRVFVAKEQMKEKVLSLSLKSFVPEVMPIEQEEQPEMQKQPEELIAQEPVIEPEIQKEVTPEPTTVTPKPKPIIKQAKKQPVAKKPQKKPVIPKKVATPQPAKQQLASRQSQSSAAEKNQFMAAIREKINQHKSYPRIAKKRGMQGVVNVSFTILSSGQVSQIRVSGPTIFHASAEQAVKSAFPVNASKAPITLPMSVSITLEYKFR